MKNIIKFFLVVIMFVGCGFKSEAKSFVPTVFIDTPTFESGEKLESLRDVYVSLDAPVRDISIDVYDQAGKLVSNYTYPFPFNAHQTRYELGIANLKVGNDYRYEIVAQKISGKVIRIEGSLNL